MAKKFSEQKANAILNDLKNGLTYNEIKDKYLISLYSVNKSAVDNNIIRSKGVKKGYRELDKYKNKSGRSNESSIKPMKKNIGHPVDSFMLDCF